MTLKYRKFSSDGEALMPGAAVCNTNVSIGLAKGKKAATCDHSASIDRQYLTWLADQPLCFLHHHNIRYVLHEADLHNSRKQSKRIP